jgi:hypothetical protein
LITGQCQTDKNPATKGDTRCIYGMEKYIKIRQTSND